MANRSSGKWDPSAEPYRVRKIRSSFAPGCHGWADSVATYATLDEAMAAMDARMTGGEYEYQLDLAKIEDGKHTAWVELANRKFRKQLIKTKHFPRDQTKAR
jgi:hypothetical protein